MFIDFLDILSDDGSSLSKMRAYVLLFSGTKYLFREMFSFLAPALIN